MSNLIDHANRELDLIGFPQLTRDQLRSKDPSAHWDAELRKRVMELVTVFSKQGHSGESANQTLNMVSQLLQYKPLSPLTNDPIEWSRVDPKFAGDLRLWQNLRNPQAFSEDWGLTFYILSKHTKLYPLLKRIPRGKFRRWVWKHKAWMYKTYTAKEAIK
jgi:hypothetical protein